MNSQDWETPDWLSMKWPGNDPYRPIYSPCIHESGNPFEEGLENPPLWNQPYVGTQVSNSFGGAVPVSPSVNGVIWDSDLVPPRPPGVHAHPAMDSSKADQSFSEEGDEEDDGDLISEYCKTAPETLSSPAKNSYKPAWKSPQEDQAPESIATSPHTTKRQKFTKTSDRESQSSNIPPKKTRRRSHRKPSLSIKASQSYAEISTESTSPEMTTSNDSQRRAAAVKTKKSHNLTEKKYRNRLNGYFDYLLSAIPRRPGVLDREGSISDIPEKKVSKGEVLVLALEHIKALERQTELLQEENKALVNDLERLKRVCASSGGQ